MLTKSICKLLQCEEPIAIVIERIKHVLKLLGVQWQFCLETLHIALCNETLLLLKPENTVNTSSNNLRATPLPVYTKLTI